MDARLFSLVIPCFKQEKTIEKNIQQVEKVLKGLPLDYEIIAVVDGLLDKMKLHDADIVVGSKTHPDSEVNYPLYRKIISFGGRFITQFLFGFSVLDTQVGLKIFKRKVAKDVFPRLLVKKFAFDIEMLAVAKVLGY